MAFTNDLTSVTLPILSKLAEDEAKDLLAALVGLDESLTTLKDEIGKAQISNIYTARVKSIVDGDKSGVIHVEADVPGMSPSFDVECASTYAGGGYGFFSVPCRGAIVLITRPQPSKIWNTQYVWFSCLYALSEESADTRYQTYGDTEGEKVLTAKDNQERDDDGKNEITLMHGVPDPFNVYADNDKPQQFIWMCPNKSHFIMSDKKLANGEQDFIGLQSGKTGKKIMIDELPTDSIIIQDGEGDPNRIIIRTAGLDKDPDNPDPNSIEMYAGENISVESRQGGISVNVKKDSEADIDISNMGQGAVKLTTINNDVITSTPRNFIVSSGIQNQNITIKTEDDRVLTPTGLTKKLVITRHVKYYNTDQTQKITIDTDGITLENGQQKMRMTTGYVEFDVDAFIVNAGSIEFKKKT